MYLYLYLNLYLSRLKKITKSVKSINLKNRLKSNKRINKIAIKSDAKIFPIYN